jgi:hypothetical protein
MTELLTEIEENQRRINHKDSIQSYVGTCNKNLLLTIKIVHSFFPFLTSSEDSPRSIVVLTLYTTENGIELCVNK